MIPPRVYWLARPGKQPTPGKTWAKATLVSGDTVRNDDDVLQFQAGSGSFSLGVKRAAEQVFVGPPWAAQRRAMGTFQPWTGADQSCLPGLGAPSPQKTRRGAPDCCSLRLLSTSSVLPSSGGKQPVTVGLLWLQQAAFVSPNSETLRKATEWAGDCFLGREPQVLSTTVGRGNSIYAGTHACVCFL